MVTEFIIIRHGESLANLNKIYAGHTDFELSELGFKQAEAAAEYFKDTKVSAIYSSDLKRAYSTALAHAKAHSLPVNKTTDLREVYMGKWENLPITEMIEKWEYEFNVEWKQRFGDTCPPDGEPVLHAGKRMHDKLIEIANKENGTVIITAHAAVIRAFWCYFQGVEPKKWAEFAPFPSNASASTISFDGKKFTPIRYSFDEYLPNKTYVSEA